MAADLSLHQARRIALAAQGFTDPRPTGRVDARHLKRVMNRIGMLQIDSVNVLVRSHYMPLFSRLGPYPMELLDRYAYERGRLFEYWGHAACFIPVEHRPLLRHRMEGPHRRYRPDWLTREAEYIDAVLDEVRERGGLTTGELDDPGERTGPWWGYGKGKIALEYHFLRGALAVRERRNFARVYDLPERVFDAKTLATPGLAAADAQREMMRLAARSLGVATLNDLANYYAIRLPQARERLHELLDAGELEEVTVKGWTKPAYLHAHAKLPRRVNARALLTPFDSLIWRRERAEQVFGFHYRIEIYVPQPQRKFGYYVLPFLLGDELVARVDLKSDRAAGTLLVQSAYIEQERDDTARVAAELGDELRSMAGWLGLDRVRVGRRGNLATELRAALR
ncbi:MAG: crosslink repair DNA glycosylase YcaQ family protein [Dehalococcoidia bacterium]